MKFYGNYMACGDKRNKWLDFGSDLDHHAWLPNQKYGHHSTNYERDIDKISRVALQWYQKQ